MTSENSDLAKEIIELNIKCNTHCQHQIEELENEKAILINRNKALAETLSEIELQLEREKQLQSELTATFENYDKEKEEIIIKLEGRVKELINENRSLRKTKEISPTTTNKILKSTETQTCNSEPPAPSSNPSLLLELTKMKVRQDKMEIVIETLQNKLQTPKISIENLQNSINMPCLDTAPSANLTSTKPKKVSLGNKRNVSSISLQVAKYKSNADSHTTKINCSSTVGTSQTLPDKLFINQTRGEKTARDC